VLELVLGVTRTPAMERAGLNFDTPGIVVAEPADVAREGLEWLGRGPVHVDVAGDEAVAVCESILVRHSEDASGYRVWRAGANHVVLRRTRAGWRIVKRTTRALDGSAAARDLLAAGALGRRA
jgi:hypothetical protein